MCTAFFSSSSTYTSLQELICARRLRRHARTCGDAAPTCIEKASNSHINPRMPKLHLALTQLKFRSGSGSGEAVQTGQDIETWHSSANRWKLAGMISMLLRLKSCSAKLLMFVVFLKLLEAQTRKTTCHLNLASWPHMSLESFHHHEVWRQHRPNKTPAIQRQHAHCRL